MFSVLKSALISLSLGGGLLLVGCQSGGAQTAASHEMASNAVQCDKCQVTWVKVPTGGDGQGRLAGYTTRKEMECADCRDAVSNFFATGNLKHECKACSGNMAVCEKH